MIEGQFIEPRVDANFSVLATCLDGEVVALHLNEFEAENYSKGVHDAHPSANVAVLPMRLRIEGLEPERQAAPEADDEALAP